MKKIISTILSVAILADCIPAMATNSDIKPANDRVDDLPWEIEEIGESDVATPIPISDVKNDENISEDKETVKYEPIVHEETIGKDMDFPEESENLMPVELPQLGDMVLFSTSSTGDNVWKSLYAERLGDDYLMPYKKNQDGQRVSGNTNRLVIEATDLTLPGKNGLDVVIKRKHDNQDYNESFSYYYDVDENNHKIPQNTNQRRYIYGFTNKTTNETVYIGFLTEDQMYTYMYNGCYIKDLDIGRRSSYTREGTTIYYYNFEYINSKITTDTSCNKLEFDSNISRVIANIKYKESSLYTIQSRDIFNRRDYLGCDWKLLLPEAYLYKYSTDTVIHSSNKAYREDYVGAFRDINGSVYTLYGNDKFVKYNDGKTESTYTSTFNPDSNKYLKFESFYKAVPLYENGPKYNFVVYDNTGLTYYFHNDGLMEGEIPSIHNRMYILAVKDEYDNMIQYEYEDNYGSITKIIDTYGREINISSINGGKQISYYDDTEGKTKNITYITETLPASALDNDSPISPKNVKRLTVTNEEGESTIYDSRETEIFYYYDASTTGDLNNISDPGEEQVDVAYGHNIERIIYPTGAETRYRYKCLYPINTISKIRRGVYAVDSSYDIVGGSTENHKEYSFANSGMSVTSTCLENDVNRKTVNVFDRYGLTNSVNITPQTESRPYIKTTYTYDDYDNPKKIVTDENGTSNTVSYSYDSSYPNVLIQETDDLKSISYSYHSVNDKLTDKISKITYSKKSGSDYETDYYITTILTDDKKSIQYEKTIQNDTIKAQKKYEYDSTGEVTAVKQWTDDTNGDGKLDEDDDIITLSNAYTITPQKTKNVTTTAADILNADGENEGSVNVSYNYNIYGNPLSQTDSYGEKTTVEYDDISRPVKYTLPNGGTRQIEYNTAKNYTLTTDEAGIVMKYVYDGLGRIKEKYKKEGSSFNKIETYNYDRVGRLSSKTSYRTSTEGTKVVYYYDQLDRVTEKYVYELPDTLLYRERYAYSNSTSEVKVTKNTNANGASAAIQNSYYNRYGQLVKTESTSGSTILTNLYEYDYLGRVTKETDPNGNETAYEYNYAGQVTKQTNAAGDSVTMVYDLTGQAVSITDANGNTANTTYDKLGRTIKVISPFDDTVSGETKTYYDKNSNIIKTAVKRSQNAYQTEEYKYDNMGNLLASISNDGTTDVVTQYQYDIANRITKMITGLSAYSANPIGGVVTNYSYNNQGYLAQIIDPMGMSESYNSYDYAGDLLSATDKNLNTMYNQYGAFGLVKTYFENSPETKEYTYNNLGQVTNTKSVNANEQTVEESYKYDAFGRLISTVANDGSVQNYTYDANSNMATYKLVKDDAVKNSIEYAYNNLNQLTKLTNNGIITSYGYDANGNLTQKSLNNGVTTNYTYNNAGLMTYMESKKGSDVYTYSECSYLLNGLMQSAYMPFDGDNANEHKTKHFNYDNMGRLIGEHVANGAGVPLSNLYEYDLRGNRIRMTGGEPDNLLRETIDYEYDSNNRLTATNTVVNDEDNDCVEYYSAKNYYDNNGNMTAKQSYQSNSQSTHESLSSGAVLSGRSSDTGLSIYRFDSFNRLINYNSGSEEAQYTYNANNLRASKTVNRTKTDFVWNGQNLASESKNGVVNTYTYDMTGVHIANLGGTFTSYLKDYHGNIIGKTNRAGEMIETLDERLDYDAFGNQWNGVSPDPFGYCGEYLDSESGLIYLRNRYYDSATGRFITEDPAKDGVNWYSYCAGNPVMLVDPSGLKLIAEGSSREKTKLLMEELSDATLGYGEDGFEILSVNENTNKQMGLKLISELIEIDDVIEIILDKGEPYYKNPYAFLPKNITLNQDHAEIYVDSDGIDNGIIMATEVIDSNGKIMPEVFEPFIALGHELVHAYDYFIKGTYQTDLYQTARIPYKGGQENALEEYNALGVNCQDENGNWLQQKSTYENTISENGLRIENGMNQRITLNLFGFVEGPVIICDGKVIN